MLKLRSKISALFAKIKTSYLKKKTWLSKFFIKIKLNRTIAKLKNDNKRLRKLNNKILLEKKVLKEKTKGIELLQKMGRALQYCKSNEEIYDIYYNYMKKLFPNYKSTLCIFSKDKTHLNFVKNKTDLSNLSSPMFSTQDLSDMQNSEVLIHYPIIPKQDQTLHGGYYYAPISARGEIMGLIFILIEVSKISQENKIIISKLADDIGLALLKVKLVESLQELSVRDHLTGLYNRRYMEEMLSQEIARATRQNSQIGLIMFDIDFFKKYNDELGHEAGDIILRNLGKFLKKCFRKNDIICRFGGEEFIIILPNTDEQKIFEKANYLRKKVEQLHFRIKRNIEKNISISVGVSSFPKNGQKISELLETADEALYQAKKRGRNRVFFANK